MQPNTRTSPHPDEDRGDAPPVRKMVRREPTKRRHKKGDGDGKLKPGKDSWVYGTKLKFFARYKDEYLRVAPLRKAGDLYTKLAKLFVIKYGYYMDDNEDLEDDIPDPPDSAADKVVNEVLPEGEAERRSAYTANLRIVSSISSLSLNVPLTRDTADWRPLPDDVQLASEG